MSITLSAFTITTNAIKNQYPVLESVASIIPMVDEIIIVDGGSTDGTVEELRKLSPKIKVIQTEDTKWEEDWVYWRMGYNYGKAFDACIGDWIMKFDPDYVFENYNFRGECEKNNDAYTFDFDRLNFILIDRYFRKRKKTLAVNKRLCLENNINLRWGYDLKNMGMCDEAIIYEKDQDNLVQGTLLHIGRKVVTTQMKVFNYSYCFRDKEAAKRSYTKNMKAFYAQQGKIVSDDKIWESFNICAIDSFGKGERFEIGLEEHPKEIQDRIRNLTPEQQGYNLWGKYKTANYY